MGMGGGGGGAGQINFDASTYASQANGILDKALARALPYTEEYSNLAMKQMQQAEDKSQNLLEKYYNIGEAKGAPFREAGYNALDTMQDTLGMKRPQGVSSSQMAHTLENKAKYDSAKQERTSSIAQWLDQYDLPAATRANLLNAASNSSNQQGLVQGLDDWLRGNPQIVPKNKGKGSTSAISMTGPVAGGAGSMTAADDLKRLPYGRMVNPAYNPVDLGLRSIIPSLMSTGNTMMQAKNAMPAGSGGILSLLNSGYQPAGL